MTRLLSNDEFDACAKWSLSQLEELYKEKGGRNFSQLMVGLTEEKRGEGYIAKKPKEQRTKRANQKKAQAALLEKDAPLPE
jgi:hypothetical protein